MMLGKLPVPGRPTYLVYSRARGGRWCDGAGLTSSAGASYICITVGQGPTALAVGTGCLVIFTLIHPFSPVSPSLWETARYRLKYCLKGPLNPKQPTNQYSRARAYCACSRCGWVFGHFFCQLSFLFFPPLSRRRPDID